MATATLIQSLTVAGACNGRVSEQALNQKPVRAETTLDRCTVYSDKARLSRYEAWSYVRGIKGFRGFLALPHLLLLKIPSKCDRGRCNKRLQISRKTNQNRQSGAVAALVEPDLQALPHVWWSHDREERPAQPAAKCPQRGNGHPECPQHGGACDRQMIEGATRQEVLDRRQRCTLAVTECDHPGRAEEPGEHPVADAGARAGGREHAAAEGNERGELPGDVVGLAEALDAQESPEFFCKAYRNGSAKAVPITMIAAPARMRIHQVGRGCSSARSSPSCRELSLPPVGRGMLRIVAGAQTREPTVPATRPRSASTGGWR